jgi:hypothetical protein
MWQAGLHWPPGLGALRAGPAPAGATDRQPRTLRAAAPTAGRLPPPSPQAEHRHGDHHQSLHPLPGRAHQRCAAACPPCALAAPGPGRTGAAGRPPRAQAAARACALAAHSAPPHPRLPFRHACLSARQAWTPSRHTRWSRSSTCWPTPTAGPSSAPSTSPPVTSSIYSTTWCCWRTGRCGAAGLPAGPPQGCCWGRVDAAGGGLLLLGEGCCCWGRAAAAGGGLLPGRCFWGSAGENGRSKGLGARSGRAGRWSTHRSRGSSAALRRARLPLPTACLCPAPQVMYHGPIEHTVDYFANLGYTCPDNCNPADYVFMEVRGLGAVALP